MNTTKTAAELTETVDQARRLKSGKWSKSTQGYLLKLVQEAQVAHAAKSLASTNWDEREAHTNEADALNELEHRVLWNPTVHPAGVYDSNLALGPIGD